MIAIYVRVSTEDQATKGYSIEGQIDKCIKKAGTPDVLKYVDEGFSGELLSRPGLNKLRDDIKAGLIEKLICYDPDRLSRNLMNQLIIDREIRDHGVEMLFVNGEYANTSEGHLFFSMRGAIAEFEKAKIKERTSNGRKSKAKKGKVVKNSGLYGYDYDKDKSAYVINEKEAKFVKMIFDYYTDPHSEFRGINGIALHLTELEVPTKKGAKVWHRQVVRQILMNEAYTGVYYQNRFETDGDYVRKQAGEKVEYGRLKPQEEWLLAEIPAIIDKDKFVYAQKLLDQGRRRHLGYGVHEYLLSGLVKCGRCGCTMTGKKRKSHGKDFYVYECRKNYAGAKEQGCGRLMSENKLNNHVWSSIIDMLNNPENINEIKDRPEKTYINEEIKHLEEEIEKTKKGRQRLITLISLDDNMDLEEVKDKIRELQSKEKSLLEQYTKYQEEIKANETTGPNVTAFDAALKYYLETKGVASSLEGKRTLLRIIVREIEVVDKDTINLYVF